MRRGHDLSDEEKAIVGQANRLEYVDVSIGHEGRGFDITGHRYWFNHPCASTDLLLSVRTDLEPEERGLEPGKNPIVWWMPEDYPARIQAILDSGNFNLRK
jgi:hypothetical protein